MSIKAKSKEQNRAEAEVEEFKKDLGPFVVAAESTRMAMVFTDAKAPKNPIIFANDSFLCLTGYAREEVLAQSFSFMVADSDKPEAQAQVKNAFEDTPHSGSEIRCRRKDGSVFWTTIFIDPVKDKNGDVIEHFASFVDVTKQKQEVEHLHFLLNELNHRTQNTLATVLSISKQTLRGALDKQTVEAFEGRIMALSKAHSLLGRKDWDRLSLRDVIEQILQPFGLHDTKVARFSVKGDIVRLRPKESLTFAMLFHELATNSAKYGSLSNAAAGKVDITWQVEPTPRGGRMRLRWQESGGPPVMPPTRKGFGSRLIEGGLAQEMDGEVSLTYDPSGVVCQIVMPLPKDRE